MPKPSKKTTPAKSVSVELVPSHDQQLTNAIAQVRELESAINAKAIDLVYDIVAAGVYWLKIRDLHCREHLTQFHGVETVSTPEGDADQSAGFLNLIEREFTRHDLDEAGQKKHFQAKARTIRNYMTAARNAGLTGDHTLEDVQRLRDQHALDDKRVTDLYRLQDSEPGGDQTPPPRNLVAEAAQDLSRVIGDILKVKDETPPELYEANVTLLRSSLEAYTGHSWGFVAPGAEPDHGEITITAPKARKPGKKARGASGAKAPKKGATAP